MSYRGFGTDFVRAPERQIHFGVEEPSQFLEARETIVVGPTGGGWESISRQSPPIWQNYHLELAWFKVKDHKQAGHAESADQRRYHFVTSLAARNLD